ncbi:polymeric immunoglobulin receptor-like [Labeo rohita]|uniref:polymeric immunoglobulin receptor-like n=1 Tax=Labeo rohita TaxID=84645 RepID=UPI0021E25DB9|nr:polymeric immunoglobulin receptor-like [Labeo rohita]
MHIHSAVDMIYPLILSGILLHISDGAGLENINIGVKPKSSGIIPCLYDEKHKENRKYWCKGTYWVSCKILASANNTRKYSLTDYPNQSIFTVQWENLQTSDAGFYWCAVEIGDYNIPDDSYYLYLKVQSVPDVSVVSSSVSGHEGGDISVQCLYSSEKKNEVKQWCRIKDQSCYTVGSTDTSQNSLVKISDDGKKTFTVLMTGLKLNDSGWYFCSVGDWQAPVQLKVTKPKQAITTESRPETHIDETHPSRIAASGTVNSEIHSTDEQNKRDVILLMFLPAMLVLLVIVTFVAIVTWRLRKKQSEFSG